MIANPMKCLLVALSVITPTAMSCSPRLLRDGVYLDVLQPTSSPRYLAAQLGYYLGHFECTPFRTVNTTIDLETGQMSLGRPPVAEIYPSGLARSRPTDTTQFKLDIDEHQATLTDLSEDSTVDFTLYASPNDRKPEYGWFVSPKFRLAYVLYETIQHDEVGTAFQLDEVGVAFVPILGRPGRVEYGILDFVGFHGSNYTDGHLIAYDDLQIAQVPMQRRCIDSRTVFYNDTYIELRDHWENMNGRNIAIQYGETAERATVYRAGNGHGCGQYENAQEPPVYYLGVSDDLPTGQERRLDLEEPGGYRGSGNCTATCRWEEFCGTDDKCHLYSCMDWFLYGPSEYTGRDGKSSNLSCQEPYFNHFSWNAATIFGVPAGIGFSCPPEYGFSFGDLILRVTWDDWVAGKWTPFSRRCLANNTDTQFLCYEMGNNTHFNMSRFMYDEGEYDWLEIHGFKADDFPTFTYVVNVGAHTALLEGSVINETLARATMSAQLVWPAIDAHSSTPPLDWNLRFWGVMALISVVVLLFGWNRQRRRQQKRLPEWTRLDQKHVKNSAGTISPR